MMPTRQPFLLLSVAALLSIPTRQSSAQTSVPGYLDTLRLAEARTAAQAWSDAAPLWERAVAINPLSGESWYQLGRAYFNSEDYRRAIPPFERAVELGFGVPAASAWNIARSHAELGEGSKAMDWLARALDLGFRDAQSAFSDSAFAPWRGDPRFRRLTGVLDSAGVSRTQGWRHDLNFLKREIPPCPGASALPDRYRGHGHPRSHADPIG